MPTLQIKDGVVSSETYVKATAQYTCPKGSLVNFTIDWPEGVTMNTTLKVENVKCPCCGEAAEFPAGKYYVKDGALVREPIAA
jgi:hypothetical protein